MCRQLRHSAHLDGWRFVRLWRIGDIGIATAILLVNKQAEFPERQQRRVRLLRLAVGPQRPHEILLAPILGDADLEDELLAAWIEVGWLSLVDRARLNGVVRTHGKID